MARVVELFDERREVIGESAEVMYAVHDAVDEADVRAACDAGIPSVLDSGAATESATGTATPVIIVFDDLYLYQTEITERINLTTWKVRASYRKSTRTWTAVTPDSRFAFDTTGGSQHITNSLETRGAYGTGAATSDFGGAIGWDGKTVKGCDIHVPVFNFSETHYFSDAEVDQDYKLALFAATGRVNDDSFRGFAAGEVLFLGASGSRAGDDASDLWEIQFRFAALPNKTGLTVGSITDIAKKGWDYMWVRYAKAENAAATQVVARPLAVYVERVYDEADFDTLGIG